MPGLSWDEFIYKSEAEIGRQRALLAEKDAEIARLRAELEEAQARDELNGECIMLMREHLAGVGIEASFADDVAAIAANRIKAQEKTIAALVAAGKAMRAQLEPTSQFSAYGSRMLAAWDAAVAATRAQGKP